MSYKININFRILVLGKFYTGRELVTSILKVSYLKLIVIRISSLLQEIIYLSVVFSNSKVEKSKHGL